MGKVSINSLQTFILQEYNSDNGERANIFKIIFLRSLPFSLLAWIPVFGMLLSFIDILFIFREDRRCLHDKFAGTIVLKR